jgi:hypothetical protein
MKRQAPTNWTSDDGTDLLIIFVRLKTLSKTVQSQNPRMLPGTRFLKTRCKTMVPQWRTVPTPHTVQPLTGETFTESPVVPVTGILSLGRSMVPAERCPGHLSEKNRDRGGT